MPELLDLCYDVLVQILEEINPEDLAACAQASKGFGDFIRENTRIYKTVYLKHFDDPRRRRPTDPEPEWVEALQRTVKCQKMLLSADNDLKRDEFNYIASTVDNLLGTMSLDDLGTSRNKTLITDLFLNISQNHDAFMCRSSLFERAGTAKQRPADDEEGRQLSAKLHSFFGFPPSGAGTKDLATHPYARSRVYDLRNYTDQNEWGPFRKDGSMRVDWEMVESIMIVVGHNSFFGAHNVPNPLRPPWFHPLDGVIPDVPVDAGQAMPDYMALLKQPDLPLDMKDPYRVQGIWSRIVCFLDYTDLYHYNFDSEARRMPADEPRAPLITEEATRHILMNLQVTDVTAPGPFEDPSMPIVHFRGKSKSVDAQWDPNANSGIRGTVRMTANGDIRWKTISVFHGGEERWRSDGVQIGGLRSPRGVVGTWFDKDFDIHGPAGPTVFWKISDKILEPSENDSDSGENFWGI
ncbi:hypothetical protein ACJQWK_01419 [Exserohilum turcicum]|uniref:F-box domain-containing protein n=1 Tax=Exserohilum turcicum (strain 28A) TaxID=671987 RepID=R0KJW2_EXST2|nr:uncharacterized protein SETTUDRAFT_168660 [Exserohilum turcica Et28A]EOA88297.1 hypothetical protein SETTUDRAFT_168660 [Exserohilum turcica Et28A]